MPTRMIWLRTDCASPVSFCSGIVLTTNHGVPAIAVYAARYRPPLVPSKSTKPLGSPCGSACVIFSIRPGSALPSVVTEVPSAPTIRLSVLASTT